MTRETRIVRLDIEERNQDAEVAPKLVGYAALFDVTTTIGSYFQEKISRGAFTEALSKSDIHALFNHDDNIVLGRMKSGTLKIEEDAKGLRIEVTPPDTQDCRDLIVKMKRGDIDQMSFAFSMNGGKSSWDESFDPPLRTVEKVGELFDISVCTRGAYPETEVAVRSLEDWRNARKTSNFSAARLRIARKMNLDQKIRRVAG